MKTISQLRSILSAHAFDKVDAHIHTHVCDGDSDMTVENIAKQAEKAGMSLIILTPHFHKQVSDDTATLYTDSSDAIFLKLREEIDNYKGNLEILLSTEADILSTNGETALRISKEAEDALDLVTPTVNYHPLLPLKAVEVTYGRCIREMHESGLFQSFADNIGGTEKILESLYETEVNAIVHSPYPAILGHFFAAHSYAVGPHNWFGAKPEHLELIKKGAAKVIDAAAATGSFIDLTGIHWAGTDYRKKQEIDGFFWDFQKWFVRTCAEKNVLTIPGSDSHNIAAVGDVKYYTVFLED